MHCMNALIPRRMGRIDRIREISRFCMWRSEVEIGRIAGAIYKIGSSPLRYILASLLHKGLGQGFGELRLTSVLANALSGAPPRDSHSGGKRDRSNVILRG